MNQRGMNDVGCEPGATITGKIRTGGHDQDLENRSTRRKGMVFRLISLSKVIDRAAECHHLGEEEIGISELQRECSRIRKSLDALRAACDTGSNLEVNLVSDVERRRAHHDETIDEVQQLSHCIGMCGQWRFLEQYENQPTAMFSNSDLQESACRLKHDLVHASKNRRMVLVCHSVGTLVLEKALVDALSNTTERQLKGGIAGTLSLDTCEWRLINQELPRNSLNPYVAAACKASLEDNAVHSAAELVGLRPRHSRRLHETRKPFLSIRIHCLPAVKAEKSYKLQTASELSDSRTSVSSPSASIISWRRTTGVWCDTNEFQDCKCWPFVRMIECGRSHRPRLNPVEQHLNFQTSLEYPISYSVSSLERALRGRNASLAAKTLEALRWVAFAFRPITVDELLTGLVTNANIEHHRQDNGSYEEDIAYMNRADLEKLCAGLLDFCSNGFVEFRDEDLKSFVLSPAMSTMDLRKDTQIHEMIATVCLCHLLCLHREAIFRPWLSTEPSLRCQIDCCRLGSYSTSFWHDHYRIAEAHSRSLSSILDRTIQSALTEEDSEDEYETVEPSVLMNSGLWICSLYDLKVLGRNYLQRGAEIGHRYAFAETALHIAAASSSLEMVKLLLEAGANPDSKDIDGMNPLHHSSTSGLAKIVTLLLSYGADVNAPACSCSSAESCLCGRNWTPLHFAASHGQADIVHMLLDAGADYNAVISRSKENALHLAVESGNEDVVRYLLAFNPDLEAQTADFGTALQIAMQEGHSAIAWLLIERGAQIRPASFHDELCLEELLEGFDVEETPHKSPNTPCEQTHARKHVCPAIKKYESHFPMIMIPTIHEEFVQQEYEGCDHDAWLIVEKSGEELEFW